MKSIPKRKRIVCRRYIRYIKTKECLIAAQHDCRGEPDPHHVVPVSLGGSDFKAVPLCRIAHEEAQRSRAAFEAKYAILFDYEIEQLNKNYLRENPPKQKERKVRMRVRVHVLNCSACGNAHEIPLRKMLEPTTFTNYRFMCVNKREWVSVA